MKKSRLLVAVVLAIVLVLALAVPAFAKGGGGGGSRGGGSFSSGTRSSGSGSFSNSSKSFSSGTKSYSTTPRTYSKGYSSTTKPSSMSGFKTYKNSTGSTVYYMPKTYSYAPRPSYNAGGYYGQPVYYHYTNNTGSNFWFWMWLMGRNNEGMDAPDHATEVASTNDAGQPAATKEKAVAIPEDPVWSTYTFGEKVIVALVWGALVAAGLGVIWCIIAMFRAFLGYNHKFMWWKE